MAITLYAKPKFQGGSSAIVADCSNLRALSVGARPSSIKMTGATDAILLFRNRDWGGGAMYLRGAQELDDLDRGRSPGQFTFRNAAESVRVTPFRIPLYFHAIANNAGVLAGGFSNLADLEARLRSTLINLNEWNVLQKTLLRYEMAQVAVHKDERHFDLKGLESAYFPIKWQSSVSVDVYLVNSHKTAAGLATSPAIGNMIIITLQHDYLPGVRPVTDIAGILAHELGHYWSSEHRSGLGNRHNIMTPGHPHNVFNNRADPKQIELWHTTLARHPMRIRDRRE